MKRNQLNLLAKLSRKLSSALVGATLFSIGLSVAHAQARLVPLWTLDGVNQYLPYLPKVWLADADAALDQCGRKNKLSLGTLEQSIELALCNNSKVRSAWVAHKIQSDQVGESRAAYYPNLSLNTSKLQDKSTTEYSNDFSDTTAVKKSSSFAGLSMRIFDFDERHGNYRSAKGQERAALANYQSVVHEVRKNVIATLFDASTAHMLWLTRERKEHLSKDVLKAQQRRLHAGESSLADVSRASTAFSFASLERVRARVALDKALVNLGQVLGISSHSVKQLLEQEDQRECLFDADWLELGGVCWQQLNLYYDSPIGANAFVRHASEAMPQLLDQIQQHHPTVSAVRAQIESFRDKASSIRGQQLPKLDLITNYYRNGSINSEISQFNSSRTVVGVTLTIPVFDGLATHYRRLGELKQADKREAELVEIQAEILGDILKNHSELNAAHAALETTQQMLITSSNLLESAKRRLVKGEADALELLNAQISMTEAAQERFRAVSEWHSSRLQLLTRADLVGSGLLREVEQ